MMLQLQGKALTVTVLMSCRLLAPTSIVSAYSYIFSMHNYRLESRAYPILDNIAGINLIANSIAVNK